MNNAFILFAGVLILRVYSSIKDNMYSPNQSDTIIRTHISIGSILLGCSMNHFNVLSIIKIHQNVCFLRLIHVGAYASQIAAAPASAFGIAGG